MQPWQTQHLPRLLSPGPFNLTYYVRVFCLHLFAGKGHVVLNTGEHGSPVLCWSTAVADSPSAAVVNRRSTGAVPCDPVSTYQL